MSPKSSPKSKKKEVLTKKAPGAPKRFKSSYILFFMHVQEEIKKKLPPGTHTAPVVSKKASELWRNLAKEDRLHWDQEAAKEKKRYIAEKELYKGPWQVPHTRAKKDPTAPRRNPSAFLLYSVKMRTEIKRLNPNLKTTDISRRLGRLWRETSEEEKRPFVEQEEMERIQYKEKMGAWKKNKVSKDLEAAEKKKQEQDEAEETEARRKRSEELATATFGPSIPDEDVSTHDHDDGSIHHHPNSPHSAHLEYHGSPSNIRPEAIHSTGGDSWWKWNCEEGNDTQHSPVVRHSPDIYPHHNHYKRHPRHYHSPHHSPHRHQQHPQHPPYQPLLDPQLQIPRHHQGQQLQLRPCRVESRGSLHQQRYSPIPLYRNDREPMFCPSPITRQSETAQPNQPEDVPSCPWDSQPHQSDHLRDTIAGSFSNDNMELSEQFDKYERSNSLFKHDPELDCSPIGSYDEFDPQFDPVPIHSGCI